MSANKTILLAILRSASTSALIAATPYPVFAQTSPTTSSQVPGQIMTTVKQVFNDRGRIVAETSATDLKVNDEMVITFENGKQCALKVLEIRENYLTLNSENCRYNFDIKAGLSLEKSLLSAPEVNQAVATETKFNQPSSLDRSENPKDNAGLDTSAGRKSKFVVGVAFSGRTSSSGTGGTATGLLGTFTSELEYREGLSVSLEMRDSPSNSWGYAFGITYDSTREFDSGTFSSGGSTISITSTGGASKIGATSLEANAVYRWNAFYIPLGLNYTAIRFTPTPGYTGGYDVDGGFGVQLGLGAYLTDSVSVEMISRASAYSLKTNQGTTYSNYGSLIYSIVTFGIKGHF